MVDVVDYLRKTRRGAMFIFDGLSGSGKNTVIEKLIARDKNLKFSVSVTSRPMREGEKEGVNYYYVSDEKYNELLSEDAFYEHVESDYGNKYGTLRSEVDGFLKVGQDVLFDLDFPGIVQLKGKAGDDVVTIGLLPPSIRELKERLISRGDDISVIKKRMKAFRTRLSYMSGYDYVVINDNIDDTVAKVQRIISGERMKRVRQIGLPTIMKQLFDELKEVEELGE
ncbi:MAG: guanylate kinase [Lactobacillaceae bacterium]|jgi:guanylate kinase|nr:guanylate kinase [Lactobacillaceae bacterium]